ncbi:carbohydrate kinase family protein [Halococcoides cellulosivorans]|uniref:Carbohydrate kinase n=1 Tax=Halococcoides cellulosivorans TaxID=1679096 RepID=A0A2R4WXJ3_9EURY|nr:carbohydrate kinase [Halococcoides cellulosivorans]AWB26252.1 carbohydrate kinase [Halococcoides cellulosivorans]
MVRVLVAGEALIDMYPAEEADRLADVERYARRAGGAPANVAVGLAALDERPWLWTRVGADPFGEHLRETLAAFDVPDRFVSVDPDRSTAHTIVGTDESGDPVFQFYQAETATMCPDPATVTDAALAEIEWLHVGGVWLADETARAALLDVIDRADCPISFDPNTRPDLWDSEAEIEPTVSAALEAVDVVKIGAGDLPWLAAEDPIRVAERVRGYGPHTVFVTRGAEEAIAASDGRAPWGPAEHRVTPPTVEAVDPTGAGDAFTAGAIAHLVAGDDLASALQYGATVGALATTEQGAMAAIPDRETVAQYLE